MANRGGLDRQLALFGNPEGVNCVGSAFFGDFLLLDKKLPARKGGIKPSARDAKSENITKAKTTEHPLMIQYTSPTKPNNHPE